MKRVNSLTFETLTNFSSSSFLGTTGMVWRVKNDMVGKDAEGVSENVDEGHSDEQLELDCEPDDKFRQELEEEMGIVL